MLRQYVECDVDSDMILDVEQTRVAMRVGYLLLLYILYIFSDSLYLIFALAWWQRYRSYSPNS